jgi:hypothetical protein
MKDMLHEVEPFMSKHDLESGTRWGQALAQQLEDTSFGLLCLTPDNLSKPWLLFEAGALTKHSEGRACCLLLSGLRPADVAGPLAQFQNRTFDEENLELLMRDVNAKLREPLQQDRLARAFAKWWPDLKREVDSAIKADAQSSAEPARPQRKPAEIIEEVLVRVREIQTSMAVAEGRRKLQFLDERATFPYTQVLLDKMVFMPEDLRKTFTTLQNLSGGLSESVLDPVAVGTLREVGLIDTSDTGLVTLRPQIRLLTQEHHGWWSEPPRRMYPPG